MPNGSGYTRCFHPKNRRPAIQRTTIAPSSTASCGSSGRMLLGGICRSVMAPGARWPVASTGGKRPAFSSVSSTPSRRKPMRPARSIGRSITSIAPSCAPTSMPRGQKRGSRDGSVRPQPGRLQYNGPPPGRGGWQAAHPHLDAGPAP